jgi:hypothetical protein
MTGSGARDDRGAALVITLGAMTLLLALGTALAIATMSETRLVAHHRAGVEALHAADGAIARALADLGAAPDWSAVLSGAQPSTFTDGPASGVRALADGTSIDLVQATNQERCGRPAGCSDADVAAATLERPWGPNNPRWQLYVYGPAQALLAPGSIDSSVYLLVWVGDDPAETDGLPLQDGAEHTNPGRGILALRAHAYGLFGVRRSVDITVARDGSTLRVLSWREAP